MEDRVRPDGEGAGLARFGHQVRGKVVYISFLSGADFAP
jgi:hypothetical protein